MNHLHILNNLLIIINTGIEFKITLIDEISISTKFRSSFLLHFTIQKLYNSAKYQITVIKTIIFIYRKKRIYWFKIRPSAPTPLRNAYFWSSEFQNYFFVWKFRRIEKVFLSWIFDVGLFNPLKYWKILLVFLALFYSCNFFLSLSWI